MKIYFKFLTAVVFATLMVLPAAAMAGDNHNTVNKSIRIDDHSNTGKIDSVNGSIRIGANSFVKSIDSVNGSINLESDVRVEGSVDAHTSANLFPSFAQEENDSMCSDNS